MAEISHNLNHRLRPTWGSNTSGRAFQSQNWRSGPAEVPCHETPPHNSRPRNGCSTDKEHKSAQGDNNRQPAQNASLAITEGRRIYVGNLPYKAKEKDVKAFFTEAEYNITSIDISIDPFTGRNPSYCFVELETKESADIAMQYLDGRDLLGRPAKIKPCVPKKNRDGNLMTPSGFVFDRWERDDASDHFKGYSEAGRRLRVSGLPKPGTQVFMNEKIRGFFKDFSIEAISKTISPHYSGRSARNHPHYLYVDFASSQEAEAALSALDGVVGPWGTVLRLSKAKGDSQKFNE